VAVLAILSALARDTENRRHFFYCVEKMGTLHETKQHESAESARALDFVGFVGQHPFTAAWGPPEGKPQWGVGGGAC
jgi:hypothetical protein